MTLISHRGAAGLAPENSLAAIRLAKTYAPTFIEIDIHCTADMVFVLYHGDIKQTYTGNRRPETYKELKRAIPTLAKLEELLEADDRSVPFMFDIKCADDIDDLINYFTQQELPTHVGFTSPHEEALTKLQQAFPHAITLIAQPYHHGPIAAIELARDKNFSGVSLNKWWLGPLPYFLCRHYKKKLMVYTINHRLWIWCVQRLFPRSLICTNYPDRYRSVISQKHNV